MSEIDCYQHQCIGIVECPSSYEIVPGNNSHRNVPIYRLEQDALDATTWQAKKGDLLLGGGSGESAALRISIPEAIYFFTDEDWDAFETYEEITQAYWSMTDAYVFCEGYRKRGWTPDIHIEMWLAEHIIAFVVREYPQDYGIYRGELIPERDGSICRLPAGKEGML
ncbi:MAG: hypothetical protein ACOYYS_10760 [Chloroflexota bacterium]